MLWASWGEEEEKALSDPWLCSCGGGTAKGSGLCSSLKILDEGEDHSSLSISGEGEKGGGDDHLRG